MPLSLQERQAIVGPVVVSLLFGALTALAVVGVHSEYGNNMKPLFPGVDSPLWEGVLTFLFVAVLLVGLFGILPLILKRLLQRLTRK